MPSLRLLTVDAATLADRHAVARLITEHHPDVAVVHGAPSLLRWRSACAALAREAGLVVVGGGRTGGGNLLLSTLGVDVEGLQDVAFTGHLGPRPPGAALAAMRLLGSAFRFAGARFDAPAGQAGELLTALDALTPDRPPAVLAVAGLGTNAAGPPVLAEGRTTLPGGVFVDESITVVDADEVTGGGIRAELTLPA